MNGEAPPAAPRKSNGIADPETLGTSVGIIDPPPDIKDIVDMTAQFVARLGKPFENEIIARNGQTEKFQFLAPENDCNAYYLDMIQKMKSGEAQKKSAEKKQKSEKQKAEQQKAEKQKAEQQNAEQQNAEKLKGEQLKAEKLNAGQALVLENKRKDKEEAKRNSMLNDTLYRQLENNKISKRDAGEASFPNVCSVRTPSNVFPVDVAVVKLTAQFIGKNGRQFLTAITEREQGNNPNFEFLNPAHPLFTYFQKLVDLYAKVDNTPTDSLESPKAGQSARD